MQYVASDIHGNYEAYIRLLEIIDLKDTDILYILGDVTDYGDGSIKILQDMMMRANVIPILGEHEYMAYKVLKLMRTSPKKCMENPKTKKMAEVWIQRGGEKTLSQFMSLTDEEKDDILDFLEEFTVYEEVEASGKEYLLIHGGFKEFDPKKSLDDYKISELLTGSIEPDRTYFEDKYIVCGHIPTGTYSPDCDGKILVKGNNIFIDCDAISKGNVGCYCLTNGKEYYTDLKD